MWHFFKTFMVNTTLRVKCFHKKLRKLRKPKKVRCKYFHYILVKNKDTCTIYTFILFYFKANLKIHYGFFYKLCLFNLS
jgi:hypothetical protein